MLFCKAEISLCKGSVQDSEPNLGAQLKPRSFTVLLHRMNPLNIYCALKSLLCFGPSEVYCKASAPVITKRNLTVCKYVIQKLRVCLQTVVLGLILPFVEGSNFYSSVKFMTAFYNILLSFILCSI